MSLLSAWKKEITTSGVRKAWKRRLSHIRKGFVDSMSAVDDMEYQNQHFKGIFKIN